MDKELRVIIVDDHQIFREGLKFVLTKFSNLEVIAEAKNGNEFLSLLKNTPTDIVLMDIEMPEMNGIEATKIAVKTYPQIKIIALTSFTDDIYYYNMIKAGALGFIYKKSGPDELEEAINIVVNGNNYFSQELLRKFIFNVNNSGEDSLLMKNINISNREKEVLILICQGFSNIEIGTQLFISSRTVDKHRCSLILKTGTKNTANLVMFAIKNKLIKI